MNLIHWTDLHIGAGQAEEDNLAQLVRGVLTRRDLGRSRLVVTGDVTHNGLPSEWAKVDHLLAPLRERLPVHILLGNHDCGHLGILYDATRAGASAARAARLSEPPTRALGGLLVWEEPGLKLVGLDSCRGNAGGLLPPLARGQIGHEQLAALAVELGDEVLTVLALHHHPRWLDPAHTLVDCAALEQLIAQRPHVCAVLFGHQHKTYRADGARLWYGAPKTTDLLPDGRLGYATFEPGTGRFQLVTIPPP